ncbi:hypothetical protein T4D_15881 [Trichinella pseudospiralis]|uniref:Uncharacterized protein n=1 Tax=Trichinella pseudospiralis TaxID=6337 RepID=A0A0V1DJJ0_TRIPS|nr:hypothetical protein T4D_15881 [Trichinella pseudospiralis]
MEQARAVSACEVVGSNRSFVKLRRNKRPILHYFITMMIM